MIVFFVVGVVFVVLLEVCRLDVIDGMIECFL